MTRPGSVGALYDEIRPEGQASGTKPAHAVVERWLPRVRVRIEAGYLAPLTASRLAAEAGVSSTRLRRAYRHRYAESVGTSVRRLRVEHAARLLAESDQTLAEVALESGFADQAHLTRAFKSAKGATPAEWRRRASAPATGE